MMRLLERLLAPAPARHEGVMGIYFYVDDAADAVRALRQAGHKDVVVFSPVPHHEIEHALEQGPSLVRWVTFTGGLLGFTAGMSLAVYAALSYPLVTGGKELVSVPPFVVPAYESMILLAGFSNLLGMLALGRLPDSRNWAPYDPRFTEDRIGIWVPSRGADAERVAQMLRGHQADEVTIHA
jgi:hypothetical protein